MLTIIALLLAGLLDRIRGGWPEGRPKWAAHVATSVAYALMVSVVTHDWRLLLPALALGELAWRHDTGWRGAWVHLLGDWWQPLRWGALWALPMQALAYWEPWVLVYLVTAPLGAWLGIRLALELPRFPKVLDLRHGGVWAELITLPIIGGLTALAVLW